MNSFAPSMSKPVVIQKMWAFLQLGKPHISLPVSLSSLTGFILFSGAFVQGWLSLLLGIFLLSSASAGINQIQERKLDGLMERTRQRPLPSGLLSLRESWMCTILCALGGLLLLWHAGGGTAAILGLLNLFTYNLAYTYLKRISLFAVIPGSLVGAIPPVIGWIAAGGHPGHHHIILLAMFFFIGQIPHTWLIMLRYDKEYKKAGFPSLSSTFSRRQIRSLTFVWVSATVLAALLISLSGMYHHHFAAVATMLVGLLMMVFFARWLFLARDGQLRQAFIVLNLCYLLIMLLILTDRLF